MPKRMVISAERGAGKTSLVMALIKAFRQQGREVRGMLSPAVFDGERKIAIELTDIVADESRLLARLAKETTSALQFGDWTFYQETFDWANQRLSAIKAADVFILDEVGPLELRQEQGLQVGMEFLASDNFQVGIITVRPKCLVALSARFTSLMVYPLGLWESEALKNEILRIV